MRHFFAATAIFAVAGAVLLGITLTRDESRADLDPPGPPTVTDWLAFSNLTFTRDAGDGGGTAEICVDVRFTHPGHNLGSDAADWLKFDCWDVVMDEGNDVSNGAPLVVPYTLIGPGGKVDQWLSATHRECIPTAAWEFRVRVTEIEGKGASTVVAAVGKAIGQGKDPRMLVAGALLEAVAGLLNELFGGEENIGSGQQNFGGGEADPNGEVEKGGTTEYFNYKVKKVVKSEPQQEPNPCGVVVTHTPTPTPTPQPTPTPRLPCEDGGNNYPGCCEDEPDGCCGDEGFPTCGGSPCEPGGDNWPDCCPPDDTGCCPSSEPECCDEGGPPPCAVPTGTPTATPTPTPVATPCPNDNDCDGVLNIVEKAYGSNPNDEISTPEHIVYDASTCMDGIDNDNDGLTDLADTGCLHSEGVGAAGDEQDLPQGPFGFDLDHPFSRSEALAASSWVALIEAAQAIDEITPEEGGDRLAAAGLAEQADILRELVGAVAEFAATSEVTEADDMGGFNQGDLDEAYELIAQGDDLVAQAVKLDSDGPLQEALALYRQAFETFAAGLHPDFNEGARGDINCDDAVDTLDPLGMLRLVAGLDEAPDCLYNGDLNCDTLFDAVDALSGLRHVAALSLQLPDGCPAPGTEV